MTTVSAWVMMTSRCQRRWRCGSIGAKVEELNEIRFCSLLVQAIVATKHKADTFDARTLTAHTMLRRVTCSAHVGLGTSRLGSHLVTERGIQLIVVVRDPPGQLRPLQGGKSKSMRLHDQPWFHENSNWTVYMWSVFSEGLSSRRAMPKRLLPCEGSGEPASHREETIHALSISRCGQSSTVRWRMRTRAQSERASE